MAASGIDRTPQLAMYRQGFTAGRETERRRWLGTASPEVLLYRVIQILADAMLEEEHDGMLTCDGAIMRGERHPAAKLTEAVVNACRRRAAAGEPIRALAREHGVSHGSMWKAVRGVTWKHIPEVHS